MKAKTKKEDKHPLTIKLNLTRTEKKEIEVSATKLGLNPSHFCKMVALMKARE